MISLVSVLAVVLLVPGAVLVAAVCQEPAVMPAEHDDQLAANPA